MEKKITSVLQLRLLELPCGSQQLDKAWSPNLQYTRKKKRDGSMNFKSHAQNVERKLALNAGASDVLAPVCVQVRDSRFYSSTGGPRA